MKRLIVIAAILISIPSVGQVYKVGLEKIGAATKNVDGWINVTDSTVISTFNGKETIAKITSRKGFTIHVTDGTMTHKYVVAPGKGRVHGFTYDKTIRYEPDKRHTKNQVVTYFVAVERDK